MENKVYVVRQALDTPVSVTVNRAFAVVAMEFETQDGGRAHVELDMESSLNVMRAMDDGPKHVENIERSVAWPLITAALSGMVVGLVASIIFW